MRNVYTVAQVNSYIKNMFSQDFMLQSVSVKGEVSNCKYHSSGHIYFTLKDVKGTISCVMFAGNRSGLSFRLEDGAQVVASGSVDVYERDGKYQLYVNKITLDGMGVLYEQFEKCKRKLEEMGMFAVEYKQPIPRYISKLGVVTAPTGAAVWDIINIATRRNPYVQIILYPAIVQGEAAMESIINGIRTLEKEAVDVIIVGRGGGSIEDLWAFNDEIVAQAVFDCSIPIISAVGHETDTTIVDFVADLRAPTPSAAAELAVFDVQRFDQQLEDITQTLRRILKGKLELNQYKLNVLKSRLLNLSPKNQIREKRTYAISLEEKLVSSMENRLLLNRHRMELYISRLKGLSPLDKLNQGFSYVSDEQGHTISDINQVTVGEQLQVYVKNGMIQTKVLHKSAQEHSSH